MRKKAPEPEFLLTAARGRKTGDDCGPVEDLTFPGSKQQWEFLSVLVQSAHRGCVQGKNSGSKKTCTGEHRHLQRARTRGTEARADEKCTCGHAVRITEPRMRQAEKIRKSANDKFRRK